MSAYISLILAVAQLANKLVNWAYEQRLLKQHQIEFLDELRKEQDKARKSYDDYVAKATSELRHLDDTKLREDDGHQRD